jgi:hypothetical protein
MKLGYLYRTFSQIEEKEKNGNCVVAGYRESPKMFFSNEYPEIYDDLQRCIDDLITGKNKTVFDTMNRRSLPDVMTID